MGSALTAGLPVMGGMSRSAVSARMGGRGRLVPVVTALVVLLASGPMAGVFADLPRAVLAAIILPPVLSLLRHPLGFLSPEGRRWQLALYALTLVCFLSWGMVEGSLAAAAGAMLIGGLRWVLTVRIPRPVAAGASS